jgi:hypothetical protein
MSEIAMEIAAPEQLVLPVLTHLNHGNIGDAIARFAEDFTFKDRGIGLEFKDKGRLTEFFQKTREYFPDSSLQVESILVGLDHVVSEWTIRASVTEPFYGALSRKVRILLHGVSVVRARNGEIAEWSDDYDGLASRRTALGAHFKDWGEL